MLHRRLASLLVTATAAGLLVSGCGTEQAAAVRVDDRSMSRSDFEDSLEFIAENDDFRNALGMGQDMVAGDSQGPIPQSLAGEVANLQVTAFAVAETLDDEGLEISENDRQSVESEIAGVLPDGADALPESMRDDFVDYLAGRGRLIGELGEQGANDALVAVLEDAEISVSSRYGSWDGDTFAVIPPGGPAPAPG